jgi:hypothetical protein
MLRILRHSPSSWWALTLKDNMETVFSFINPSLESLEPLLLTQEPPGFNIKPKGRCSEIYRRFTHKLHWTSEYYFKTSQNRFLPHFSVIIHLQSPC